MFHRAGSMAMDSQRGAAKRPVAALGAKVGPRVVFGLGSEPIVDLMPRNELTRAGLVESGGADVFVSLLRVRGRRISALAAVR